MVEEGDEEVEEGGWVDAAGVVGERGIAGGVLAYQLNTRRTDFNMLW